MYILKIKGTAGIPDFIQLRGDDFTLASYFRLDNIEKGLIKSGQIINSEKLEKFISGIPFGELYYFKNE